MTTAVEIKRWTRRLVEGRSDLVLQKRRLAIRPIHHICRWIFFEGSSDRTDPRALWSFALPFVPKGLPVRLWSGYVRVGHSTDESFLERVFEQFTTKIDQDLKPVSTIESFYEMTLEYRHHEPMTGLWQLSRQPEYHACVLAALGRLAEAQVIAERCIEPIGRVRETIAKGQALLARHANSSEGKYLVSVASRRLDILVELERLANLAAAGDRAGVAILLHEWELQRIRLWEVEDLWEPTPFPIELGAGD